MYFWSVGSNGEEDKTSKRHGQITRASSSNKDGPHQGAVGRDKAPFCIGYIRAVTSWAPSWGKALLTGIMSH